MQRLDALIIGGMVRKIKIFTNELSRIYNNTFSLDIITSHIKYICLALNSECPIKQIKGNISTWALGGRGVIG